MSNSMVYPSDAAPLDRILRIIFRSPVKRVLQAVKWLAHYPAYHRLNQDIHSCGITPFAATNPEYRFKFLGNYLSPVFSVAQRGDILRHSYRFLASQNLLPFRTAMAGGMAELWSRTVDGERYDAVLGPVKDAYLEGDLTLIFRCEGQPLYRLTFTFLPGSFMGIEEDTAIFIGGSQGYRGTVIEARRAAKLFGEVCPATLLLLLLKAISKTLGLRSILGIPMALHSCQAITRGKVLPLAAYDAFWEANGAEKLGPFYHMTSDLVFRPSEASSSAHRARARRKQERKMRLYAEMLAKFGIRQSRESTPAKPDWKAAALVPA